MHRTLEVNSDLEEKSLESCELLAEAEHYEESDLLKDSSDEFESDVDESLAGTILNELADGTYTCLICISEIDAFSKIWSCLNCFRVYDFDCIRLWAKRGLDRDRVNKTWKCPACNIEHKKLPGEFSCWCGKVKDPAPNPLTPFSCGNTCGTPYEDCIHRCAASCHPGRHPVCAALGPKIKCDCGKFERQEPCIITPYKTGWKCGVPCNNNVCCFGHKCSKKSCHLGFCGKCMENILTRCYCGKNHLNIQCSNRFPLKCETGNDKWIGNTPCEIVSKVYFDCGIHYEERECSPPLNESKVCKFSPLVVKTCYCGKTKITSTQRTKCTDTMVECDQVCGKVLSCGCTCLLKCHKGECECHTIKEMKCSCENHLYLVTCKFIQQGFRPKCKHKCPVLLSCRKHEHREICCSSERIGLARERARKKSIRNRSQSSSSFQSEIMTIESAHICTRICNRLKSCGKHYCEALCHAGPCGVCLESSNDDLICNCGKTVIEAPVRCGSKLNCREQCIREKPCHHRQEPHECHGDEKQCPKCTATVEKECNCGYKKVPNVLCSQASVSCGTICKSRKECGHYCMRVCSADCTKRNVHENPRKCISACNKNRESCPHICKEKCHYKKPGLPLDCDDIKCKELIKIKCPCGRNSQQIRCNATRSQESNLFKEVECDEMCTYLKRQDEIRKAFINLQTSSDLFYTEELLDTFNRQTKWCSQVESIMRSFISTYRLLHEESSKNFELKDKVHRFPPMSKLQRKFIHDLADVFNLYSESQDQEPKRSVFILMKEASNVPSLTIADELNLKEKKNHEYLDGTIDNPSNTRFTNSIIITDIFFGVTKELLEQELDPIVKPYEDERPVFVMEKDSYCIFYFHSFLVDMNEAKENKLYLILKTFKKILKERSLAFDCKLYAYNIPTG